MLLFGFIAGFILLRRVLLAMASMRSRNNGLQATVITPHNVNQNRPPVLTFSAYDHRSFSVDCSFTEPALTSLFPERRIMIDFGALAENLRNVSPSADPTICRFQFSNEGGQFLMEMFLDFDAQNGSYGAAFGCVIMDTNQPIWRSPVVRRDYMIGAEVSVALLAQYMSLLRGQQQNVFYQLQVSLDQHQVRISMAGSAQQLVMEVGDFFTNGPEVEQPQVVVFALHRQAMRAMIKLLRLAHQAFVCADETRRCVVQCTLPDGFGLLTMSFD